MIVEDKVGRVAKAGFGDDIKFKMEANATAYNILIKNIYTDPIKAIIRELGTNALESHIKAGRADLPFKVTLPSYSDPNFVIRDYGVGLSPDEIRDIYTTFFCSDKRDSNEVNGCFGIGSKCPFAYAENFTIQTFKDGFTYLYNAYMDETGTPGLAELSRDGMPTDEVNGVKITIPVLSRDIHTFTNTAQSVYKYFRTIPEINTKIERQAYRDIATKSGWKVRAENGWSSSGMRVVMGDVAYAVEIGDKLKHSDLAHKPIDIFCNIGDISIDSGRERVQGDKKTLAYLNNRLDQIVKECEEYVTNELSTAATEWELRIKAKTVANSFMSQYAQNIEWNNQTFSLHRLIGAITIPKDADGNEVVAYDFGSGRKNKIRSIAPVKDMVIVRLDKCTGPHRRCEHYAEKNYCEVVGIKCDDDAHWQLIVDAMKCPKDVFKLASELERPEAIKVDYDKYKSVVKYKHSYYFQNMSEYWERDESLDVEDAGYYVRIDRGAVVHDGVRIHPSKLKTAINRMGGVAVYGVIGSLEEEFIENGWKNLYAEVDVKIKNEYTKAKADLYRFYNNYISGHSVNRQVFNILGACGTRLKNPVDFTNLQQRIAKYADLTSRGDLERDYHEIFSRELYKGELIDKTEEAEVKAIVDELNALEKKYPLLTKLGYGWQDENVLDHIALYVNSI